MAARKLIGGGGPLTCGPPFRTHRGYGYALPVRRLYAAGRKKPEIGPFQVGGVQMKSRVTMRKMPT
jgi:hypothetical protein